MRRLVLYGIGGIVNTAVTFAIYVVLVNYIDYRLALIAVYPIGILISYVLNGVMVFGDRGHFARFVGVYVLLLAMNMAATSLLVEIGDLSAVVAQVPAMVLVYLIGYSLNRRFVFGQRADSA